MPESLDHSHPLVMELEGVYHLPAIKGSNFLDRQWWRLELLPNWPAEVYINHPTRPTRKRGGGITITYEGVGGVVNR